MDAKNVIKALTNIAPRIALMAEDIKNGRLHDVLPVQEIVKAYQTYATLKANDQNVEDWLGQLEFADRFILTDYLLVEMFEKNKRSATAMTDAIGTILDTVDKYGDPNQMMIPGLEIDKPTAEAIIREGIGKFNDERLAASERKLFMRRDVEREFSKERHKKNMGIVADMQPIAEMDGSEFEKGPVDLLTQVSTYFESIGNVAYSPIVGEVELVPQGVRSSINKGMGRMKAVAFTAVPAVLEHGQIVSAATSFKGRDYDSIVVAALILIGGDRYYAAAVVKLMEGSNKYYLHEVAIDNGIASTYKTGAGKTSDSSDRSHPTIRMILQQIIDVNTGADRDNSDIRYSARPQLAPPMYSQMQREIDAMKGERFAADSMIQQLRNKGVKADEIRWSGLQTFLQGKKSVSKAELLAFARGNE